MTAPALPRPRPLLLRPGPYAFAGLYAIDSLTRGLIASIIPLEALAVTGSERGVAILGFVVAVGALATRFWVPPLIRRFGRRRVFLIGAVLTMSVPLLIWSTTLAGQASGQLARLFAVACFRITTDLYIMELIPRRELVRAEPIKISAAALGWAVGPVTGMTLFLGVGPWAAFLASTVLGSLTVAYFLALGFRDVARTAALPRAVSPLRHARRFLAQPRLRLAWLISFARSLWWMSLYTYGPIYVVTQGGGPEMASWTVSIASAMLFFSLLYGRIGRRFGVRATIVAGFTGSALCAAGIALTFGHPTVGAALLVCGTLSCAAVDAVGNIPFMRAVRARERPEMTMLQTTSRDAADLVPQAVFAVLLSFFDLWSVFAAIALTLLLVAWFARWVPRSM